MNYEERQKRICKQCGEPQQYCGYAGRGLEGKCPVIQEKMDGWELGWQDATDKAWEWWKEELTYQSMTAEEIAWIDAKIEDFKKYMEEQ